MRYKSPADFKALVIKTSEFLRRPVLRGRYIVDQINNNYITNEVLSSKRLYRSLILLREPTATIKSMLTMHIAQRLPRCWTEDDALSIYLARLEELTHYASVLKSRALIVYYEDLISRSNCTLNNITSFLGLETPLSSVYATHRMTARIPTYGDSSDNIKVGRIIETAPHPVTLRMSTVDVANQAFDNARQTIHATCPSAITHTGF